MVHAQSQYGTESIIVVSFRSSLPYSTVATSPKVLIVARCELYDMAEFNFRLFLNLHDYSSTFITWSFRNMPPRYNLRLGGSSSVSGKCSCRILCPCKSNNNSVFCVRFSSDSSWCSAYHCLNIFRIKNCTTLTKIPLGDLSSLTDPHGKVLDQSY